MYSLYIPAYYYYYYYYYYGDYFIVTADGPYGICKVIKLLTSTSAQMRHQHPETKIKQRNYTANQTDILHTAT